jgi:lipopolysaccharide biosynthesis protein
MSRITNAKHRIVKKLKAVGPTKLATNFHSAYIYKRALRNTDIRRNPSTKIAIVLHLYYPEAWTLIKPRLKPLESFGFDLFVTIPSHNILFGDVIRVDYSNAYIIESPNQGRDVLPFLVMASEIEKAGYLYILKLHSKKSTHRKDGGDWFENILEHLVPSTQEGVNKLLQVIDKSNTAIIGPAGQYVSLTVNFEANGMHMTRVINKLYSNAKSFKVLQQDRKDYGFFAGTMFWARIDAIKPIVDMNYRAYQFESEKGQIDGTFAHALERIFCLVPEIEGRKIYEIEENSIREVKYSSGSVPDWSDVYIGPKPEKN